MKPSELPPLSPAQREIMQIVWDRGEISTYEVREIIGRERAVARNTVRTMMERMEQKGWLTHRVIGRTRFYSARVAQDMGLANRVLEFVDKTFAGEPDRLMAALIEHRGLSAEEIERIQKLLDESMRQKTNRARKSK
ncbi:MAG: BlaI/MecI/CopY family transcriptional regulator [Planctomycetales bacterium]|nr:BlaI/MecI/CopY family transcriptional regulator [Planctomycetales bacterium]MCA9168000.1 BlaI/MecI/CopY family transcriptional regulator [Planctomycetales bacterium]